jgi:hypothetical protein
MERKQIAAELDRAAADAAAFFMCASENLRDEHQSARDVISHLVFWHRALPN